MYQKEGCTRKSAIAAYPVARFGRLEALRGYGGSLAEAGSRGETVLARGRVGEHLVLVARPAAPGRLCAREGACSGNPGFSH